MSLRNWIKGLFVGSVIGTSTIFGGKASAIEIPFIQENRLYDNSWSDGQIKQRKKIWDFLRRDISEDKYHVLRVAFDNLDSQCIRSEKQLLLLKKRLDNGDQPPYSVKHFIKEGNDNLTVIRDFMNSHKEDFTSDQIKQLNVLSVMYANEIKSNCEEMVTLMKSYQKHVW